MSLLLSLDNGQFDSLLKAVEALKSNSTWHWQSAIPIFLGSLLGLLTGVFLDAIRRRLDQRKANDEKNKKEVQQIKCALIGIGFNIQTLRTSLSDKTCYPIMRTARGHILNFGVFPKIMRK